ncbi:MAG: DUF4157 domain-containing protein, partial [Anaerolineae bacterium]
PGCGQAFVPIQRKEVAGGTAVSDSGLGTVQSAVQAGGGSRLTGSLRSFFSQRFGQDLGQVRIHNDAPAHRAASSINAAAFTVGQSIWFGQGQYQPESSAGLHLLGHELAHTLQQKQLSPTVQSKLLLGSTTDQAEQRADRAATAVLTGQSIPHVGQAFPMIRRTPRDSRPRVTPTDRPNEVMVTYQGHRYRVRRRLTGFQSRRIVTGRGEAPSVDPGADRSNIWLDVTWCSAGNRRDTRTRIRVGADVPAQLAGILRRAGESIIGGANPDRILNEIDLTPFANIDIRSGRGRVVIEGGPTFNRRGEVTGGRGRVSGRIPVSPNLELEPFGEIEGSQDRGLTVQGGLRGHFGPRSQPVRCREHTRVITTPVYAYECTRETPASSRTLSEAVDLYFVYARDVLERRPNRPATPLNQAAEQRLRQLINSGYRVQSIIGRTSPEGPLRARRPGGFENQKLSEDRAAAAQRFIGQMCGGGGNPLLRMRQPTCFSDNLVVEGRGELFSSTDPQGRELRGAALAQYAVPHFMAAESEASRREPGLQQAVNQARSPRAQAELIYWRLRRAEIGLTKRIETPARSERLDSCPPAVQEAAATFLNTRQSRRRRR